MRVRKQKDLLGESVLIPTTKGLMEKVNEEVISDDGTSKYLI